MEFQYLINNNWGYPLANHGGADPGAIGTGMQEKDYSLLISDYMFEQFKKAGVPVVMTRTDDETLSPTERVERILSAYGDDSDVIVISNHLNAGGAVLALCDQTLLKYKKGEETYENKGIRWIR